MTKPPESATEKSLAQEKVLREFAAKGGLETATGLIPLSTSFLLDVANTLDALRRELERVTDERNAVYRALV